MHPPSSIFPKKAPADRVKLMLGWFVDGSLVDSALDGTKISESMVETIPKHVSSAIIDDACNLAEIKPYFEDDAWLCVESLVKMKKEKPVWFCPTCKKQIGKSGAVCCDSCLEWRHAKCASLTDLPKSNTWFCRDCYK